MPSAGYNSKVGQWGEDLAGQYLVDQGYKIIDKNFHTRFGEIDLIAQKVDSSAGADEILFLEVKTRTSNLYGYPEQAVDAKKVKHLLEAIKIYRHINELSSFWRLDVISIVIIDNKTPEIKWFKNITIDYC